MGKSNLSDISLIGKLLCDSYKYLSIVVRNDVMVEGNLHS